MRKILGFVVLAFGIIIAGGCVAAQGQTGDCYATLPGCLDSGFLNGKVSVPTNYTIRSITIQQIGGESRIVAFGQQSGNTSLNLVSRFLPNGALDTTFGTGGTVATSVTPGLVYPNQVAIQTYQGANKILVAGDTVAKHSPYRTALAQFTENGAIDKCFGDPACINGGVVYVNTQWVEGSLLSVAVQPWDGRIVVVGESPFYNYHMIVARFNPGGSIDTTFGSNGQYFFPNELGQAFSIAIDSFHRIVIGGFIRLVAPTYEPRPILLRLTQDGALDTTFGTNGYAVLNVKAEGYTAIAIDALGGVVGFCPAGLHRYDHHGVLDTAFANGTASWQPLLDSGFAMVMQPDGKLLVGGVGLNNNTRPMTLWRFNTDGTQDVSFGVNGAVSPALASTPYGSLYSIALQPDGKLVAGGIGSFSTGTQAFLARYYAFVEPLDHDIAVRNVVADAAAVTQGSTVTITVTVGNNSANAEEGTVALTDGSNPLGTDAVTLLPGESKALTHLWLTDATTALGDHTLVATVTLNGATDQQPANNSRSTVVRVNPANNNIVLTARGYKTKGTRYADLAWTGGNGLKVDVFRNNALITTTANDGAYTDNLGGGGSGSFSYKLCDGGTTRCSNTATVVF